MIVTLSKTFRFEAAHRLPRVPEGHKCRRLHGHSFRFEVHVRGPVDPDTGFLIDYGDITAAVEPLRQMLDHHYLNEIEGLENPTSEVLANWLWIRLAPKLTALYQIIIHETCTNQCIYRGEHNSDRPV